MAPCDKYLELISARLDGALSPKEYAELEAHLAQCPECRALAEDLSALSAELRDLPVMKAPEGLSGRVMKAVAEDNVVPFTTKKKRSHRKQWASCAAVLALVLIGSGGLRDWQSPAAPGEAAEVAQNTPGASAYGGTGAPADTQESVLHRENENAAQASRTVPGSGSAAAEGGSKTKSPIHQTFHAPAGSEDPAPAEAEPSPTALPDLAPNINMAALALPPLTGEDTAAMARLLDELDWAEPVWESEDTALLLPGAEGDAVTALTWAGRSEDGCACLFDLTSRTYAPAWAEGASPTRVTPLGRYAVPLDGSAIRFASADPVSN